MKGRWRTGEWKKQRSPISIDQGAEMRKKKCKRVFIKAPHKLALSTGRGQGGGSEGAMIWSRELGLTGNVTNKKILFFRGGLNARGTKHTIRGRRGIERQNEQKKWGRRKKTRLFVTHNTNGKAKKRNLKERSKGK